MIVGSDCLYPIREAPGDTALPSASWGMVRRLQSVVLAYHAISPPSENPLISGPIDRVSPQVFRQQLVAVKARYQVVSVDTIADRIRRGKSIDGFAAVTFDDGYASVLEYAVPVLNDLGIDATLYLSGCVLDGDVLWRDKVRWIINEGLVDAFLEHARQQDPAFLQVRADSFYRDTKNPQCVSSRAVDEAIDAFLKQAGRACFAAPSSVYCTRNALRKMSSHRLTLGNHGHKHYLMSTMTRRELLRDVRKAEKRIRTLRRQMSRLFSLPNGTERDMNNDTVAVLHRLKLGGVLLCAGAKAVAADDVPAWLKFSGVFVALNRFMPQNEVWN